MSGKGEAGKCNIHKLTSQTETDMSGAAKIDTDMLSASVLINVDSEEAGAVCFGCAGESIVF